MSSEKSEVFKNELLKNAKIESVALKNGGFWGTVAKVNQNQTIQFNYESIDEDYLSMIKLNLLRGRNFSKEHTSESSNSVLVNESFVKEANWKDLLN